MKVLSLLAAGTSAQFSDDYEDYGLAGRRFAGSKDLTQYADWTGSPRSCSPNQGPILKQFRCYKLKSVLEIGYKFFEFCFYFCSKKKFEKFLHDPLHCRAFLRPCSKNAGQF